jgi:drug/metabolite transporter (DMT)-like permease
MPGLDGPPFVKCVYPLRVTHGWFFLAAAIATYGLANFLQAVAARRVDVHRSLHPSLLLRLVLHKTYLIGLGCQILGFICAFFARRDLPLFLVQTAVAAGLGVTAILGVLLLKWRHPPAEIALLIILGIGLAALIVSAQRSPSKPLGTLEIVGLAIAVIVIGVLGRLAARLHGSPGSVALGALAGVAFGAVAVASRPLANTESVVGFVSSPLLYILVAHAVVGQLLLGLAMQRGSATAAVASMDAASAIPAALIGLFLLGDRITPGLEWLAGFGFVAALGAVIGLTRYAEPQIHPSEQPRETVPVGT